MAVADITSFEVTYKDVMAPIGYKRTMCGMDGSVGGNITRGLEGAFPTFIWSEHGDSDQCVDDIDLVYNDDPVPPGFIKVDKDLLGGLDSRCYLCYKLTSEKDTSLASANADESKSGGAAKESDPTPAERTAGESKTGAALSSPSSSVTTANKLPICAVTVCYEAAHDLTGTGYTKLDKNILAHVGGQAYIHYRRRLPSDRLRWSAKRLELGDLLDAKDTVGNWCFAVVIEIDPFTRPNQIKVHFTRWEGTRWDQWYHVSSNELAEYGTRSKEETSIKKGKLWSPPGGINAIDSKISKFLSVIDEPFKLDELIEKQLDMFVSQCLGYNVTPKDEMVPVIFELLRVIVEALANQLASDRPLSRKLLSLGVKCLYGDPSVSYFFEHEGFVESSVIMGVFGSKPKILGLDDNEENPFPEEDFVRTRGRLGQGDSRYYGALINLFGAKGGFGGILRRMQQPRDSSGEKGSPPRISLEELKKVIQILEKPAEKWYVGAFQETYFPKFEQAVFERLGNLTDEELSKLDQKDMQAILTDVESLLLHTLEDFSGDKRLELFQLHMGKTLLTCPFLSKRLLGVELLLEWIQRAERKDEPSYHEGHISSLYYGYEYRSKPRLPRARWLDVDTLAKWLTDERIFEIIMRGNSLIVGEQKGSEKCKDRIVQSHPSIINKSMQSRGGVTSLLQFLAKQQKKLRIQIDSGDACLSKGMLNLLWDEGALSTNQMTSESCIDGIEAAAEDFPNDVFEFFNIKISAFPLSRATQKWVNMFSKYAEMSLLASATTKKRESGGFFSSLTPRKSSSGKVSLDPRIVLDKLYDIVFSPPTAYIEREVVSSAKEGLLKALKGSAETLQVYMRRMMVTFEQGEHVKACMSMIDGLLPLLSVPHQVDSDIDHDETDNAEGKRSNSTYFSRKKPNDAQDNNRRNLDSLSSTVIQLITNSTLEDPKSRDVDQCVSLCRELLLFLKKIMIHANLSLGVQQVNQLWESCTSELAIHKPRNSRFSLSYIFFAWLSTAMAEKLIATRAQEQIFHDLICKRVANPGKGEDTSPLFHCFKNLFDRININEGKLLGANRATTLDLIGMEAMWAFLVADTPKASLDVCINKLISLVLGLHKTAYGGSRKRGIESFINKCFGLIRNPDATDAQLQSVLHLLSIFLERVSMETLQYDPERPEMIMRAVLDVQWKNPRNPNLPGPWYRCTVDHFNPHDGHHHCTYHDDDDKRWYEFKQVEKGTMARGREGTVDFRAYLHHRSGYHDVQIVEFGPHVKSVAKEFAELQRFPRQSLSHNKDHFDVLFELIGREHADTARAAWNLLTAKGVPTNPERKTRLALCGASENEISDALQILTTNSEQRNATERSHHDSLRSDSHNEGAGAHPLRQRTLTVGDIESLKESEWINLLGNGDRSPLQLLYSLRILESLVFPSEVDASATQRREAKNYGVRFIRSGGFVHLYKILIRIGANEISSFSDNSLSKKCLVCLLGLFNKFYKQSCANIELQLVVSQQMQDYGLDESLGDLAPRLLQIVETISSTVIGEEHRIQTNDTTSEKTIYDQVGAGTVNSTSGSFESKSNIFESEPQQNCPLSIEGRAIENAMGLLVSIIKKQPSTLKAIYSSGVAYGAVSNAILRCSDRSIRICMGSGLNRLCLNADSSDPNIFILGLLMRDLDLIVQNDPDSFGLEYASQSREYFMLLAELLKRSTKLNSAFCDDETIEGKKTSGQNNLGTSPFDIANRLGNAIRSCPIVEESDRDHDPRLLGLLTSLSALLARDSSKVGMDLKADIGVEKKLTEHLIERCLFDAPSAQTASKALKPPICKSANLRRKAFDLLLEICRGCDANIIEVARLCSPRHVIGDKDIISANKFRRSHHTSSTVATAGASTASTTYIDYNGSRSSSGYVGLKNMCCTCYMNSTMQNLFMILPFRRAILGINDVDLGDKTESIIYQTQRMFAYLQESEKQFYDPKGFCHTYKDPDDPSRPINVRIQQDASAFFGRLLHTISDKLVNTAHENILDVFNVYQVGEKFATGSDGHKYKSNRDEPTEQYVSVPVMGVKNLEASLAKLFAGEIVDFKWDKHDDPDSKEELSTRKRITIKRLPPCLALHLKRFDLNYETFQTVKLNDKFEFPLEINMFPYTLEGRAYYDKQRASPADDKGNKDAASVKTHDNDGSASVDHGKGSNSTTQDPMFVPPSAPHPPEHYCYELVGITIHSGTANGGHYFSYIRERQGDVRRSTQSKRSASKPESLNSGSEMKWYEFNDLRVSSWSIDHLEKHCFGGEDAVTKRVRFQNAFMLFYERKNPVQVSHETSHVKSSEQKMQDLLVEQKTSTNVSSTSRDMPAELYQEIWGQNMVNCKIRNLLDPSYAEFMQQLVGLTLDSSIARLELVKFATQYMLGTLVYSEIKSDVARDWKSKLIRAYAGSPEASEWFLQSILDQSNHTIMENLYNFSKLNPMPGETTRALAKAALLNAQRAVLDMEKVTPELVREAYSVLSASAKKPESKFNSDLTGQQLPIKMPHSLLFLHKLLDLIEAEPSANWIYDMISGFVSLGDPEIKYVLRAGLIPTLLNLIQKYGIRNVWPRSTLSEGTKFASDVAYAEKVSENSGVRVHVSGAAFKLLAILMTGCLNLDNKSKSDKAGGLLELEASSRSLISDVLFIKQLMHIAFGTQIFDLTERQKRNKVPEVNYPYPHANHARSMLEHLAWNSPSFSALLNEVLVKYFEDTCMNTIPLHTAFRFIVFLITLDDDLKDTRTKDTLDAVSNFVRQMLQGKYLKMTAYLIHHVLMLCSKKSCSRISISYFSEPERGELLSGLYSWLDSSPYGFGPDAIIDQPGVTLRQGQGQFLRADPMVAPIENDWDPWPQLSINGLKEVLEGHRPDMMGYDADSDEPESIVGRRIEVWWHKERRKYSGLITRYNPETKKHLVHYDDNDQKWYGLGTKIGYRLRPEGETGHPQGTEAANAHSRKYNRVNNYF